MLVPNRHSSSDGYRYGFQGQEKDDEIKGEGNSLNYTFRMHDPRVGRFFAVDPLYKSFPWNSSYAFSENKVLQFSELEGGECDIISMAKMGIFGENAFHIVNGIDKSVSKRIDDFLFMIQNPKQALVGFSNTILAAGIYSSTPYAYADLSAAQFDNQFGTSTFMTKMAIQKSINENVNKLLNGDLEDRAEVLTSVITEFSLAFVGGEISNFAKLKITKYKVPSLIDETKGIDPVNVDVMGGKTGTHGYLNFDNQADIGIADKVENFSKYFGNNTIDNMVVDNPQARFMPYVEGSIKSGGTLTISGQFANPHFRKLWDGVIPDGFEEVSRHRDIPSTGHNKTSGAPIEGNMNVIILRKK